MIPLLVVILQGGCPASPNPVDPPLLFLVRHQSEDGSWSARPETCHCGPVHVERPVRMAVDDHVRQEFDLLLKQFEDDEVMVRDQAQRAIVRLGARTVPLLQAQLRHPVLEVRDRCRDTLHRLVQTDSEVRVLFGSAVDLRRTSLALLAFVGSGYTPTWNLSLWDPALKRCHTPRDVTRRALHWILSNQDDHGFFSTDDPVSNVLAALAVCEMYGWTEMATLKEPAMKGIAAVRASRSTDRSFLIWKGVLLESARVLELQPADTEVMRQLGEALVAEESLPARFGGVLLLRLAGTRNYFMPRMPDVNLDASSPEEAWLASTAAIKVWGRKSREWVSLRETFIARLKAKPEDPVCEGAAVTDDGICTAAFRTMLVHRFYEYGSGLLNYPANRD